METDELKRQHTDLLRDFAKHEAVCEERWKNMDRRLNVLFEVIERTDAKIDKLLWKFAGIGIALAVSAAAAMKALT